MDGFAMDPRSSRHHLFSSAPPWSSSLAMPMSLPLAIDPTVAHAHALGTVAAAAAAAAAAGVVPGSASPFDTVHDTPSLMGGWSAEPSSRSSYATAPTSLAPPLSPSYGASYAATAMDFMSAETPHVQPLPIDGSFMALDGSTGPLNWSWEDVSEFQHGLISFAGRPGLSNPTYAPSSLPEGSPTDTYLEVRSLTSSSSDNGWTSIDYPSLEPYRETPSAARAVFNPSETLHLRTYSDSSNSDATGYVRRSFDSVDDRTQPLVVSPMSDVPVDVGGFPSRHSSVTMVPAPTSSSSSPPLTSYATTSPRLRQLQQRSLPPAPLPTAMNLRATTVARSGPSAAIVVPVPMEPSSSASSASAGPSPSSQGLGSPLSRRPTRKAPTNKASKTVIRRASQATKTDSEKRVGRRRGPLLPEQRKQANEIRKLRACLRCKFLKKTCDTGEPCAGCQPSHARLWQVPCTRIDIKDVGLFMKDWKADIERHVRFEFTVGNIRALAPAERIFFITHGYGVTLPISAREVSVRDDECFTVDWVESIHETPLDFEVPTARYSAGVDGVSTEMLSEYLDRHIDGDLEHWVDNHFEGTPFLTEILKTAYRYYQREPLPVVRKALKFVLAYNLTLHLTLIQRLPEDDQLVGEITDETSKFEGQTLAPVMINFEIKFGLSRMWRTLQKELLEELSILYSGVYGGEKLKNWPTIFFLVALLLAVWEEMQFDCHYRALDPVAATKFCQDMESVPVGVIVGLFSAISQKLPSFSEWDTKKHHHLLHSNGAVCDAMTEVREHVLKYEDYLRSRTDAAFDKNNFDSLSNKFLSRLVIRAN